MEIATTRPPAARPIAFDPICGSPLPPLYKANPFCDGGYFYYFCSVTCRRFFIDQRNHEAAARDDRNPAGRGA